MYDRSHFQRVIVNYHSLQGMDNYFSWSLTSSAVLQASNILQINEERKYTKAQLLSHRGGGGTHTYM